MESSFSWFLMLPFVHGNHDMDAILGSWLVAGILIVLALMARGQLNAALARAGSARYLPDERLTVRTFFELVLEFILGFMKNIMGSEGAQKWAWFISPIFLYIFFCNIMGVIPGFLPPTENINTNLAISVLVFFVYNIAGIRAQGAVNYFKHFLGPVWWLAWFMVIVETVSHLVRPASLAVRLFGNINGDHIVLSIFSAILPGESGFDVKALSFGIPIPFLGLGMFVSFMQAFVFSLLTTVYISMATSHESHDESHGSAHH